jgi:hypothetical protein
MKYKSEMQKHGRVSGHTERSTSRKVHPRGKGPVPNDSTEKEAGDLEGSSRSRASSYSQRKRRRKRLPRVINLKNSERTNLPPSTVR